MPLFTAHYLYPFLAMNCSYDCLVTGKIMIKACGTHKKDNIMLYVFYSIIAEWSHGIVTAHAKHSPASGLQGETMFWMWHFHKALSLYYHILVLCPCQYSVFCQWQAVSRSRAMYSAVPTECSLADQTLCYVIWSTMICAWKIYLMERNCWSWIYSCCSTCITNHARWEAHNPWIFVIQHCLAVLAATLYDIWGSSSDVKLNK